MLSHPPRNPASRAVVATENLLFGLRGSRFRFFAHPPAAMLAILAEHDLQPTVVHRGPTWQVAADTR